jgi:hypothetical protein
LFSLDRCYPRLPLDRSLVADHFSGLGIPENTLWGTMIELQKPTPDMISAAYEAVRFDEGWAVNSGRDFKRGVKAMIDAALANS